MSQNYEESPVSDNKMDISEATTSQESIGVSPTVENPNKLANQTASSDLMVNNSMKLVENATNITNGSNERIKHNSTLNHDINVDNARLDNDPNGVLRLGQMNKQPSNMNAHRSELTVANSHPLMSSPESDSEGVQRVVFSYPDVVPESEPLRLASPLATRMQNKNIAQKTSTSSLNVTTSRMGSQRRKFNSLRETSPDLVSSGSEHDLSQYQANVDTDYQSVALIANSLSKNIEMPSPKPLTRRKIPLSADLLSDDMSSIDSISNHSFDDDLEHNLASLSPSSSVLDGLNDKDADFADLDTPTNLPRDPIPQYTAQDERRDSRNWQKITLPDGRTREIDMRVIEPYKRVLSHGGYLQSGGHNAIVIFCACHLPDRSRTDYHYVMDNLFLYVVKTLEQLVTEDYVLIYLHGGSSRRNVPPFPWLKKCYQLLDRRLRKSLKNLYLVHPTFWLKSVVWMSRPFVSTKFWRKLVYVRSLDELYELVPVQKAAVPQKVKNYDSKCT